MHIVLTYDPRWKYTPKDQVPFWASLDTVDLVAEMLVDVGMNATLVEAGHSLETNLIRIKNEHPESIVFWLNEFMPTDSERDTFTVEVIEKANMMHTGPGSKALGTGLNKEATKDVFRSLGLPTPESYVVYPDDFSTIHTSNSWMGHALVKPLLQGCSRGLDECSVVQADDFKSIHNKVDRIHQEFNEPALVERYVGGTDAKEYTAPALIAFDGRIMLLPITEIELSKVPIVQEEFRFLTGSLKENEERNYLKIPGDLSYKACDRIRSDVRKIIKAIGCRDMTRIDMRCDSTGLYYIEVNVNPRKDRYAYLILAAYSLGFTYEQIIAYIPYQAILKYEFEPPKRLEELVYPMMTLFWPSRDAEETAREAPSLVH